MSNGRKKPPMGLNDGEEEPQDQSGELGYAGSAPPRRPSGPAPKGGSSLLPAAFGAFIAFGLAAAMILTYTAPKGDIVQFYGEFEDLRKQVTEEVMPQTEAAENLSEQVDTAVAEAASAKNALEGYVKKGEIPTDGLATQSQLDNSVEALQARIDALELLIEEEEQNEEEGSGVFGGATRWSIDFVSDPELPGNVYLRIDSDRIEESGIYDLELTVENHSDTDPFELDSFFELYFLPRDYVQVDEYETYLDSDRAPFIGWRSDFETRLRDGVDVTRRIEFRSEDKFTDTIEPNGRVFYDLVFELSYLNE